MSFFYREVFSCDSNGLTYCLDRDPTLSDKSILMPFLGQLSFPVEYLPNCCSLVNRSHRLRALHIGTTRTVNLGSKAQLTKYRTY